MPGSFASRAVTKDTVSGPVQDTLAKKNSLAFGYITALFFIWGFITCLNDILIPHLKSLFQLNYAEAMLVQSAFFSAYFIFSIPAGRIVRHFGYPHGISIGLGIAGCGALLFIHAGLLASYPIFLTALFILACGITLLQVAANPYASALGPADSAPARLNFAQAFNSLGTTVAPLLGSYLILREGSATDGEVWSTFIPYLVIGLILFGLAVAVRKLGLPAYTDASFSDDEPAAKRSVWTHRHLLFGVVAIFCYVGAEVSLGSFLVNYMASAWELSHEQAGRYAALYWGGAMVGRFAGTYFLKHYRAETCLGLVSATVLLLIAAAIVAPLSISPALLLLVGLFNAIMFPVIFSLSIRGLGFHTSQGASYLCMAIVGGAVMPVLQGSLADAVGVQLSFLLPWAAYAYVFFFARKMRRSRA